MLDTTPPLRYNDGMKHYAVIHEWNEDFPWAGTATHKDCIAIFETDQDALTFCEEQKDKYSHDIEVWEGSNKIATLEGYSWSGRNNA